MSYSKINWVDGAVPALNATNLNRMDDGIYSNSVDIAVMGTNTKKLLKNSPNYVTSGTVYNSVNSLRQTVVQNKADIEKSLADKYDAANNEIGSGELSPAQTIYEGSAGKFVYVKNGVAVTVSVNITSMLADTNYLQMSGLPFPSKTESKLASIAVYSTKNKLRNVRIDGSWIYVSSTDKFAEGEKNQFHYYIHNQIRSELLWKSKK